MFSNQSIDSLSDAKPDVNMPLEENPRVKQIAGKSRFYLDKDGKPASKMKTYNIRDGIFEAVADRFYKDASLVAYGEENREWGGAFAVYRGLTEALPYHRLFNSPIAEAAIIGTAIGYAMCGGRVIPEIMYCDFLGCCGDEIFNQLPKWQAMSGNILKMPVVVRVSVGSKYGATSPFVDLPMPSLCLDRCGGAERGSGYRLEAGGFQVCEMLFNEAVCLRSIMRFRSVSRMSRGPVRTSPSLLSAPLCTALLRPLIFLRKSMVWRLRSSMPALSCRSTTRRCLRP